MLLAVFFFLVLTFRLGEGLSRVFGLRYPRPRLVNMTVAVRNAPLMLAITMIALPDQPLIYAALVIGMLVEFPRLPASRRVLLLRQDPTQKSHNPIADLEGK